jgi:hypothetical protein
MTRDRGLVSKNGRHLIILILILFFFLLTYVYADQHVHILIGKIVADLLSLLSPVK